MVGYMFIYRNFNYQLDIEQPVKIYNFRNTDTYYTNGS